MFEEGYEDAPWTGAELRRFYFVRRRVSQTLFNVSILPNAIALLAVWLLNAPGYVGLLGVAIQCFMVAFSGWLDEHAWKMCVIDGRRTYRALIRHGHAEDAESFLRDFPWIVTGKMSDTTKEKEHADS